MSNVIFSKQIDNAVLDVVNRAKQHGFDIALVLVVTELDNLICTSYPDAKCIKDAVAAGRALVFVQRWRETNPHYDPDDPESKPYRIVDNACLEYRYGDSSFEDGMFTMPVKIRTTMRVPWLGVSLGNVQYEAYRGIQSV